MRIGPIITAIIVASLVYLAVFERDSLRALAGIETEQEKVAQGVRAGAETGGKTPEDAPVPVLVKRSRAVDVPQGIILRGMSEAVRKVQVKAETQGKVISEPLLKGARVSEGDVLCRLDPGTRPALLKEARAQLKQAETTLRNTRALHAKGVASDTQLIAAEARFEAAQAAVERVRKDIENLAIRAPFPGRLESDTAELGALLQPGMPCATIVKIDPIRLVGYVPEVDVERLKEGAAARATLSTGAKITGKVSYVALTADPLTRTFRVEVEVPNPGDDIREGLTAEIFIETAAARGHLLPRAALTLDDEGRLGVRIVAEGNTARFVPVTILRDTPEGVWLAGLPEEAMVIVIGQEYVIDGQKVEPHEAEGDFAAALGAEAMAALARLGGAGMAGPMAGAGKGADTGADPQTDPRASKETVQ